MQGFKGAIVAATLIGMAITVSACKREHHEPMKLGAADITIEQAVRV